MASFSYIVISKDGKEKKGTMEASNEDKVLSTLRSEGYIVVSVVPQNILNKDINIKLGNPIKARDYSIFCRQFVSILSAGVSIISALDMLSEQTSNKEMSKGIKEVQIAVEKGETLTNAMKATKIFPGILIHMVEAGEASGNLEIAFERMASHFEKDAKIKSQVKKAMIYPMIIAVVAIGVIFLMMLVVVPTFMGMFTDMNVKLPYITQLVVSASDFVQKRWYIILGLITTILVGIRFYINTPAGKNLFGYIGLKMPLFGNLTIKSSSSRYARTLSTLLVAGIPMIEALEITAKTMDNVVVRQVLLDSKEEVTKGIPLSTPIKNSGIFPPMVCHMTKIGEETGNMEGMLEKVADYYDEEVEVTTQSLMAIMEPMIIVVLAIVVGGLLLAIMQPMMSMYGGIDNL